MATQSFAVGTAPRIVIGTCSGDLKIEGWDARTVEITSDEWPRIQQTEEALMIDQVDDELVLRVPYDADIMIEQAEGDVTARGFGALAARAIEGDVSIARLTSGAQISNVSGDLQANDLPVLHVSGYLEGDLLARAVAQLEIERVEGDADITSSQTAKLDAIGGDFTANTVGELVVRSVGGDAAINQAASVQLGDIGGDFAANQVQHELHLGSVGGDCSVNMVGNNLFMGSVGGDCTVSNVGGELHMGSVGGDASISAERANTRLGNIGGDLRLRVAFAPDSVTGATVGGDAVVEIPADANLTIRATVGGDVSGERLVSSGGGMFTAVYGEGAARLDLLIGGDLHLKGGSSPRTSSSSWDWGQFGDDMSRLGQELGREFSQLGQRLTRELNSAFGPDTVPGEPGWQLKIERQVEKQVRHAEQQARRAEERMQRDAEAAAGRGERRGRMHVRINDREWRFDAERLERLKQQARDAAREGISGAMAAVDRALAGLGVPPAPPAPPAAGVPTPPAPPPAPMTGQTIRIDTMPEAQATPAAAPRDIESERAAILQMVAEGRISPEEGDMLLDALG